MQDSSTGNDTVDPAEIVQGLVERVSIVESVTQDAIVTDRRNKMSQQQHAAEEQAKHDRNRVAIARDARAKAKEVRRAHIYALNDLYRHAREQRLLQAANE